MILADKIERRSSKTNFWYSPLKFNLFYLLHLKWVIFVCFWKYQCLFKVFNELIQLYHQFWFSSRWFKPMLWLNFFIFWSIINWLLSSEISHFQKSKLSQIKSFYFLLNHHKGSKVWKIFGDWLLWQMDKNWNLLSVTLIPFDSSLF